MTTPKTPDNSSRVPKYSYADTLEAQEAQLQTDPLMQRLLDSRKRYADDPYRPLYHYVNPESTLNDPNGLCFWRGRWHLFYQAYPPEDPRQHWGHAISSDLIHWRDLPYAIYPGPEECCYSGSTLVEDDRVIAMYHGYKVGNMVAVSSDPLLLNWEKVTGQAVIPLLNADGSLPPYRVFDPCIWKKDGLYYSLSGGILPHQPSGKRTRANFLFSSVDLIRWHYLHPFVEGDRFTRIGDDGACPYFWPIGDRHILLFASHASGSHALLGDYDHARDKFVATAHADFNFGAMTPGGIHAPSATPDGQGGVIVIFNINAAKATPGWDHIMSLPRRLTLLGPNKPERDELGVEPAGDIESLRTDHQQVAARKLPANQEIVLDDIRGKAMEIIAKIDTNDAPLVEMNVLRSPGKEEFTRIALFRERGFRDWERYAGWDREGLRRSTYSLLVVDSSYSSVLPDVVSRAPETAPLFLDPDEPLTLRVFVDNSVVEVFANGKQCIALRVYPGREDSIGVSLRAQGRDAQLIALDAWQMKSIYS